MTKFKIGDDVVWEELSEGKGKYTYVRGDKVELSETQYNVLDVLIKNTILHNNFISLSQISDAVKSAKSTVASAMTEIKKCPVWCDKIETGKKGSRIKHIMAITEDETEVLLGIKKTSNKKEKKTSSKKIASTMVADRADLIGCCYPDIAGAVICTLTDNNDVYLSFNFGSNQAKGYPEFISAVFRLYDDLNVLEYYELNRNSVLRMEIINHDNSIKKLQIEFQTEFNRVVGPPYVINLNEGSNSVDLPISSYAKYTRDMKKIQNLCFVINKDFFIKAKGTILISNVSFVF